MSPHWQEFIIDKVGIGGLDGLRSLQPRFTDEGGVESVPTASIDQNEFLTLEGIPPETLENRLGNRTALEWVIDQYQVSTDKRSGIINDPNRPDDPEYIVRLLGQVITVSLETVKVVKGLRALVVNKG